MKCGISDSAVFPVFKCNEVGTNVLINPIIQTRTCHSRHMYHPTHDNIYVISDTILIIFILLNKQRLVLYY
jgi:hypothetical protein